MSQLDERVQVYPLQEVIGATVHGAAVRIWHCVPVQKEHKRTYQLRTSDWFECDSAADATAMATSIQRAASWGGAEAPPRVVVVVNPFSGQGRSQAILSEVVLPMLRDAAGLQVQVHVTQAPAHATSIVRGLDLSQVASLLFLGGDGTTHEGIQGLLGREDWQQAVSVPFCPVPTGSGNGLAASLGLWCATTAAYAVCKRLTHAIDMASVLQPPSTRLYIFLSVAYGMLANLDIGTEKLRFMGEARFTLGGVKEIFSASAYPLRAALWPASQPVPAIGPERGRSGAEGDAADQLPATAVAQVQVHPLSKPTSMAPPALQDAVAAADDHHVRATAAVPLPDSNGDGGGEEEEEEEEEEQQQQPARASASGRAGSGVLWGLVTLDPMREALLPAESSSTLPVHEQVVLTSAKDRPNRALSANSTPPQAPTTSAQAAAQQTPAVQAAQPSLAAPPAAGVEVEPASASSPSQRVFGAYPGGPPLPILATLGPALPAGLPAAAGLLPQGWSMLPDHVGSQAQYFMLQNPTHLALNVPMNPRGHFADGLWELMHVSGLSGWVGRWKGTKFLLATDTGKHVDMDVCKTEQVRALVLEPLAGDRTWLVVDGEQVPRNRPLFIEVHPCLCQVLVSPTWEAPQKAPYTFPA